MEMYTISEAMNIAEEMCGIGTEVKAVAIISDLQTWLQRIQADELGP